jgi:hypothetical protein
MASTSFASTAQSTRLTTTAVFGAIVVSSLCAAGHREKPDAAMSQTHGVTQ